MKTLCNCTKKWDICTHCYMANLEDWSHIHAIAMSAEADRRLQEDLRFLESVNVWHLVNLRSQNPHALYSTTASTTYPERLDIISPSMNAYSQNSYNHIAPSYLESQKYLSQGSTTPNGSLHSPNHHGGTVPTPPISAGIGTSLPYPDLILHAHAKEMSPRIMSQRIPSASPEPSDIKTYDQLESLPKHNNIVECRDFSPVIQNPLPLKETPRLKHLTLLPKEPEDYDADENSQDCGTPDGKKSVKFTADTVFVERDMESPFWRAFSERRRLRRMHRQKKQMNAQSANNGSYQPSLLEIMKSAFSKNSTRDANGNNTSTKRKHLQHQSKKGEVLVYDNSSQIPESYTAQYIYSVPPSRSHKLLQIISCQCCSAADSTSG